MGGGGGTLTKAAEFGRAVWQKARPRVEFRVWGTLLKPIDGGRVVVFDRMASGGDQRRVTARDAVAGCAALLCAVCAALMGCGTEPGADALALSAPVAAMPTPSSTADCVDGDHDQERYGTNCGCCHKDQFAAVGSVALGSLSAIEQVEVVDDTGQRLVMAPNPYGNFFRHRPKPVLPVRARVVFRDGTVSEMKSPVFDISCNGCHQPDGGAPRIGRR